MKRFGLLIALVVLLMSGFAGMDSAEARKPPGRHYTKPYTRKNGTHVRGYMSGSGSVLPRSRSTGPRTYSAPSYSAPYSDEYTPDSGNFNDPYATSPAPRAYTPKPTPTPRPYAINVPSKFTAQVIDVIDGDTVAVFYQNQYQIKVRLFGIDAPEDNQAFGGESQKRLSDLLYGKTVSIINTGTDKYGRVLGWIYLPSTKGQVNINASMVRGGYAWWYKQYAPKDTKLAQYQALAKKEKQGLWRDAAPIAPWDFRH